MTSTISGPRRLMALAAGLATALSGALVMTGTETARADTQYGAVRVADGVLPAANKCGTYTYVYDLKPPAGAWALETFMTDPRGNVVSSYAVLANYTPGGPRGSTTYTLCRNNTLPGAFRIVSKLSSDDGNGNISYYPIDPVTFTMVDAPKVKKHVTAKHAKKNKKSAKAKQRARQD